MAKFEISFGLKFSKLSGHADIVWEWIATAPWEEVHLYTYNQTREHSL